MAKNTNNTENVESVEDVDVVVCKGHTVYHNGEQYGENRRLALSQADAQALQARGFVVPFDDVLALYKGKSEAAVESEESGNAG